MLRDSVLARLLAWVLLILGGAVCAWMGYLNVRDRWDEPANADGELPPTTDPRILGRALVAGLCGTVALLCAVFLFG